MQHRFLFIDVAWIVYSDLKSDDSDKCSYSYVFCTNSPQICLLFRSLFPKTNFVSKFKTLHECFHCQSGPVVQLKVGQILLSMFQHCFFSPTSSFGFVYDPTSQLVSWSFETRFLSSAVAATPSARNEFKVDVKLRTQLLQWNFIVSVSIGIINFQMRKVRCQRVGLLTESI